MKLKNKIKSFFNLDSIEEDLQKEESTKVFEKINLFKVTREKILLWVLFSLLVVNVLVGFNIDFYYIRPILTFLFLLFVPGLLLMLSFKIRKVGFWEYLVYTVGLSISFIMFAGLIVNWTLPFLGITNHPLSTFPILICFNIFLLILTKVAWNRNKDFKPFNFTVPKLDALNNTMFIIPMFFPVLSILGAFLLNNHGPNILTMIMLGAIAVYVLLLTIFRKKLNHNIYPWAILMISSALLLQFSLRSWFISGWDISQEQYVFRLSYENMIWDRTTYSSSYNSCLSLSILPTIINLFMKINSQIIFKLIIQLIFSFHSVAIFLLFRKYLNNTLSFIGSFLYFGTGYFNFTFPALIRQEIAFIFFGLILLLIFTKEIQTISKKILLLIFGISIVVSHYSTAYITLGILSISYIFLLFYNKIKEKLNKGKKNKKKSILNSAIILILLIFGFLWMAQITDTSKNLIQTAEISVRNIGDSLSYDLKQSNIKAALFGSRKLEKYTNLELNNYINEIKYRENNLERYNENQTKEYSASIFQNKLVPPLSTKFRTYFYYVYQFSKYVIIFSFLVGFLFLLFNQNLLDQEFLFMVFLSISMIGLIIFLPYISKAYNFERLFQQSLIFLSIPSVIFFRKLFKNNKNLFFIFILLIYLIYSLYNLGGFFIFYGGDPPENLYNSGSAYNAMYSHKQEISSILWIGNTKKDDSMIYLDTYSELKLYSFGNPELKHEKQIIPPLLNKNSYIYSSYSNTILNTNYWDVRERFNKGTLTFNFPNHFLNENKNNVYNNGGSKIYK